MSTEPDTPQRILDELHELMRRRASGQLDELDWHREERRLRHRMCALDGTDPYETYSEFDWAMEAMDDPDID